MQRKTPFSWFSLLGGFVAGVGYMYYFDPDRGRYRRSLIRDQLTHLQRVSSRGLNHRSRDLGNRARGVMARVRSSFSKPQVSDDILVARVAARLGRLVKHAHPIELTAEDGVVHLSGPILSSELDALLVGITKVPGVRGIVNHLETVEDSDNPDAALSQAENRRLRSGA